jgi:hypothetical protein
VALTSLGMTGKRRIQDKIFCLGSILLERKILFLFAIFSFFTHVCNNPKTQINKETAQKDD